MSSPGFGSWFKSKLGDLSGQAQPSGSSDVVKGTQLAKPAPAVGVDANESPVRAEVEHGGAPVLEEAEQVSQASLIARLRSAWDSRKLAERQRVEEELRDSGRIDVIIIDGEGKPAGITLSPLLHQKLVDNASDNLGALLLHVSLHGSADVRLEEVLSRTDSKAAKQWIAGVKEMHFTAQSKPNCPNPFQFSHFPAIVEVARSLKVLVLRNHKITTVPAALTSLFYLEELILSNCAIKSFPQDEISKLHQLQKLDLSCNNIGSLKNLGELITLRHLNVSGNQLLQIPSDVSNLHHLVSLHASHNRIPTLSSELSKLSQLQVLDLSHNLLLYSGKQSLLGKFVSGAAAVEALISLVRLDLSHNKMSRAPAFAQLTNLVHCDVSHNSIDLFPPDIDCLAHLEYFNISFNSLKEIPLSGLTLPALRELYLDNNELTEIPPSIDSLTALEVLTARSNKIATFPRSLARLQRLRQLDLTLNELETINPVCFSEKVLLQHLILSQNHLRMIPESIALLPQLSSLDISSNQLQVLPAKFPASLRRLNATANAIRALPSFDHLKNLSHVHMALNPLDQIREISMLSDDLVELCIANTKCKLEPHGTVTLDIVKPIVEDDSDEDVVAEPTHDIKSFIQIAVHFVHPIVFLAVESLLNAAQDVGVFGLLLKHILLALDPRFPSRGAALSALSAIAKEPQLRCEMFGSAAADISAMILREWNVSESEQCVVSCLQVFVQFALDPELKMKSIEVLQLEHMVNFELMASALIAAEARKMLAIYGYVDHLDRRMPHLLDGRGKRSAGIRILTLDGGGARAIVSIQVLKRIEQLTGKKTCELFDVIGGTSTGSLLAALMGMLCMSAFEVEALYLKMIQKVFVCTPKDQEQSQWSEGLNFLTNLFSTGARYHTQTFESMLKEVYTEATAYDMAGKLECPKVFLTSSDMSLVPAKPYLFRSYGFMPGNPSRYDGTMSHYLWQGIRATSAAPSLFEPLIWEGRQFQDGGLVANNPTALAYHEAMKLWPGRPFDCVLSLGTGMVYKPQAGGFKDVVVTFIESACSVERVDEVLQDHLDPSIYFRFNPSGAAYDCLLDETSCAKLQAMAVETRRWIDSVQADRISLVADILNPNRGADS